MQIEKDLLDLIHRIVDERVEPIRVSRLEHDEIRKGMLRLEKTEARLEDGLAEVAAGLVRLEQTIDRSARNAEERFARIEAAIEALIASQVDTTRSIRELRDAQLETSKSVDQLTRNVQELREAQAETKQTVDKLARNVHGLSTEFGAWSEMFGLDMEEMGKLVVPHHLHHEEGVEVLGKLEDRLFRVDKQEIEVDLYGQGRRAGEPVAILGECKARIYPGELDAFERNSNRIARTFGKSTVRVIFCHRIHPDAKARAAEAGIIIVPWQYQYRMS